MVVSVVWRPIRDAPRTLAAGNDVAQTDESDAELVARVQRGDSEAFDRLARRYAKRAFVVANRLLRNAADAEDVVQDAFIAALNAIDSFDAGRPFGPWFIRIVVNKGLTAIRSRSAVARHVRGSELLGGRRGRDIDRVAGGARGDPRPIPGGAATAAAAPAADRATRRRRGIHERRDRGTARHPGRDGAVVAASGANDAARGARAAEEVRTMINDDDPELVPGAAARRRGRRERRAKRTGRRFTRGSRSPQRRRSPSCAGAPPAAPRLTVAPGAAWWDYASRAALAAVPLGLAAALLLFTYLRSGGGETDDSVAGRPGVRRRGRRRGPRRATRSSRS